MLIRFEAKLHSTTSDGKLPHHLAEHHESFRTLRKAATKLAIKEHIERNGTERVQPPSASRPYEVADDHPTLEQNRATGRTGQRTRSERTGRTWYAPGGAARGDERSAKGPRIGPVSRATGPHVALSRTLHTVLRVSHFFSRALRCP